MADGSNMDILPGLGEMKRVPMLNAWVHDVSMDEIVENFTQGTMLTLHVDMIMKLQKDREFHDLLDKFDVITCDSQIMYFATKWLGTPVQERVSGSDYFPKFYTRYADDLSVTVFLLGGKDGIAELAAKNINAKVGREMIVGAYAPAFDFETKQGEIDRMIEAVNASGASVCLVGLGGGRQEKWIMKYRDRMPNVTLWLPLGGTIDYESGTFDRPPVWITDSLWLSAVTGPGAALLLIAPAMTGRSGSPSTKLSNTSVPFSSGNCMPRFLPA